MNWLREFYKDLRFLTRHSRRLIKALVRSRLDYKRIYKHLFQTHANAEGPALPCREPGLEVESQLLERPAQYVGQAQDERSSRENDKFEYHQG